MGRSKSLLSGGEEKTCRWRGGCVPYPYFSSSSQGLLNWFPRLRFTFVFQILGASWTGVHVNVFQAIFLNSAWFGMFQSGLVDLPPLPASPFPLISSLLSLSLSLLEKKDRGDINPKRMYFQTGCLRWQHRSLAAIKIFALPDRLFLFCTLYAVEWITGVR